MREEPFLAAAVQASPVFLDREGSLEKARDLISEAAREGAKLIAFPEAWLPGYPAWIYGAAGWEDAAAKKVFARLQRNAVEVPSPTTDSLCEIARELSVHVVMGLNELDPNYSRGTIYNSQLFISHEGRILGTHRKLLPTHAERIVWGQGDGSSLHVFDTDVGRLGGLICWEHWMPLTRFAMHAKAEQVHIAAWPDVPDMHQVASRHYAFEGRTFVISVGSVLTSESVPADFEAPRALRRRAGTSETEFFLAGGSCIVGPDGQWVAEPAGRSETIVYGEIDLGRIAEEQQALDSVGHYNRPDIFQLTVDERDKVPITWKTAAEPPDASSTVDGDIKHQVSTAHP